MLHKRCLFNTKHNQPSRRLLYMKEVDNRPAFKIANSHAFMLSHNHLSLYDLWWYLTTITIKVLWNGVNEELRQQRGLKGNQVIKDCVTRSGILNQLFPSTQGRGELQPIQANTDFIGIKWKHDILGLLPTCSLSILTQSWWSGRECKTMLRCQVLDALNSI